MVDMNLNFSQCNEWLQSYHQNYRNPVLGPLQFSACYYLSERASSSPMVPNEVERLEEKRVWLAPWIDPGKCGVYLVFDENFYVIYIGKTSGSRGFEHRPACYFAKNNTEPEEGVTRAVWEKCPMGYVTVAVAEPFEAPSLEEYLITMAAREGFFLLNKIGFQKRLE